MVEKQTELTDLFKMLIQEKTTGYESEFFKKLNETVFWIPMMSKQQGMERKNFQLLMTADERKFVPVFLHKRSRLGRFLEEQLIEMPYNKLKYLIIDSASEINGIVINPFEENIVLDRKIMRVIDAQTMGMTLKKEDHIGRIKLRKPDSVPKGLMDILKLFFEKTIEVESAWLLKARNENEVDEHWMLLVDFDGEKVKIFPQIAALMKPYMQPGERFELIQKNPDFITKEIESTNIYNQVNSGVY